MIKNFNNATEALNFSAKVRETIENARTRSAWDRGVQAYALELLDNYDEYVRYAANNSKAVAELSETTLLNGAADRSQYTGAAYLLSTIRILPNGFATCRYDSSVPTIVALNNNFRRKHHKRHGK